MCCTSDNHNYMCHTCAKEFFKIQAFSYWQNIKFSRYCPKFHIFTNIVIFKYFCNFLDQLLHPYKFHGRDMSGILFFIFANCHPLMYMIKTFALFMLILWCTKTQNVFKEKQKTKQKNKTKQNKNKTKQNKITKQNKTKAKNQIKQTHKQK